MDPVVLECDRRFLGPISMSEQEAMDYYWMSVLVPLLMIFLASVVYLLAGEKNLFLLGFPKNGGEENH